MRAIWLARELALHKIQFVEDGCEILARLIGLTQGQPVLGIVIGEVGHGVRAGRYRVTSYGRTRPNANGPNSRANGAGASRDRSRRAPVRWAERRRVRPGSPWPELAGRLVPRRPPVLPRRRV